MLITAAIIGVIAIVIAGGFWTTRKPAPAATPAPLTVRADSPALVVGNDPKAPVKVVVYEDFLCPYCQQFERQTRGFLHADAAEGRVLVEYRPFKLLSSNYSTLALNAWGRVLDHGTPKQALQFHDALYDSQPYESTADSYGVDSLVMVARGVGVPSSITSTFGKADNAFLNAAQNAAIKAKVTGTPTVVVNGAKLSGGVDQIVSELQAKIDAAQ